MYVCVCNAITERQIEHAVHHGNVSRMRELRTTLGVTADCSSCAECALQCLRDALANPPSRDEVKIGAGATAWMPLLRANPTHSLTLETP